MKKKGFTLIEMIVVAAIFLILITAGYDFFANSIKTGNEERHKANIDNQVKDIMDFINDSLKSSWQNNVEILFHAQDGEGNFIKDDDGKEKVYKITAGGHDEKKVIYPIDNGILNGFGIRVHIPYDEKFAEYKKDDTKSNAENDFNNNSYALTFMFNEEDNLIYIQKDIPEKKDGVFSYKKTVTNNAISGYVKDFKVCLKPCEYNGESTSFGEFIEINITLNYKGYGVKSPFKRDLTRTFNIYYNLRKD